MVYNFWEKDSELSKALGEKTELVDDSSPQPQSHASDYVCKWNTDQGPCDMTMKEEEIADHLTLNHLPPPGRYTMKCRWEGCKLRKSSICRDTIIRHIRQIDLGIKPRRLPS